MTIPSKVAPKPTNWWSFGAVVASIASAVITQTVGSAHVATAVQAVIVAVAGILVALHVHMPRILGRTASDVGSSLGGVLESLGKHL